MIHGVNSNSFKMASTDGYTVAVTFNNGTNVELTDTPATYDNSVQRVTFPGSSKDKGPLNFYEIKEITFTVKAPSPP